MHGCLPPEYLRYPQIDKPIAEIYDDLNSETQEHVLPLDDTPEQNAKIDMFMLLPPVRHQGHYIKGLFFSQGVDIIYKHLPEALAHFHAIGRSMRASYSWSDFAHGTEALYDNPSRVQDYLEKHPEKKDWIFIPGACGSDFINERVIKPQPVAEQDIDVLVVSRVDPVKNLAMLAGALKIYRHKYQHPLRVTLVTGHSMAPNTWSDFSRLEWQQVNKILSGNIDDYFQIIEHAQYQNELPSLYSRAKCVVLTSLTEGKNRSIHEAMACDTPVICFAQHNQYQRGQSEAFPKGAGEYVEHYHPEALAETIHNVIQNSSQYTPRASYLKDHGRLRFLNRCIDAIPYYHKAIPNYQPGRLHENAWLQDALSTHYGETLESFLYRSQNPDTYQCGLDAIQDTLLKFTRHPSLHRDNIEKLSSLNP
jgi:glycosyltransferase involved in cell wall biosynthesis